MGTNKRLMDPVNSDSTVPGTVLSICSSLEEWKMWYMVSQNAEARSCRDAARKRVRLGHVGIPLWDELKSFFGKVLNASGHTQYVVVHCRGDRILDLDRVGAAIGSSRRPERLTKAEIGQFGLTYGLVNPFEPKTLDGQIIASSTLLQVFDSDVLTPLGVPNTMMTNAGDLRWAIEFRPAELIARIDNAITSCVARPDPHAPVRPTYSTAPQTIGIITGNAPESGMALWRRLNTRVREIMGDGCYGDISMPRVIVTSLPELGLSMELNVRKEEVWDALRRATVDLCRDGVGVLALACNTTHYFTPQIRRICTEYGAEFVSMPEVVASWLRHRKVDSVAIVGIEFVTDLDGAWSAYTQPFSGLSVEIPKPQTLEQLHRLAYLVKAEGANEEGLNRLRDILNREITSDHVVMALTELSLLLERQRRPGRSGKILVDPLALYSDALAARYLGAEFP